MDPVIVPPVTQQTADKAQRDKLKATGTAVATTVGVTAANYRFNAPGGKIVQVPLKVAVTGINVKPTDTGRASVAVPKASIVLAFLPQPVGYIPAEQYGLRPDFWKDALGFPAGSKPYFFEPTEDRVKVFQVQQVVEQLAAQAYKQTGGPSQYSPGGLAIPPGPINLSLSDLAFLQSLPPNFSNKATILLQQLQGRENDLRRTIPAGQGPVFIDLPGKGRVPIADTFTPSAIQNALPIGTPLVFYNAAGAVIPTPTGQPDQFGTQPVNDNGLRNEANRQGIDRELIHERADP